MDKMIPAELIVNANAVLCALAREKMPVPLAYKIVKWCKSVESEIGFYTTRFQALLKECAASVDDHGGVRINPDKREYFDQELEKLRSVEMCCPDGCFTLEELSCLQVSPSDMAALDPFVKE